MAAPGLALAALELFADIVFVVAMIYLIRALVKGLFGPLTVLPVIGGAIGSLEDKIVHALNNALGAAVSTAWAVVGASWHALAHSFRWFYREYLAVNNILLHYAHLLAHFVWSGQAVRVVTHHLAKLVHAAVAHTTALGHDIARLRHRVGRLEHEIGKGIGDDVLPRLKSLDHRLDHLANDVIPSIREAEAEAAGAIDNLYEWAKGKASLLGVGTFAFAVAAVLSALGIDWLACKNGAARAGRAGCALWDGVGDLFGLFLDVAIFTNVCAILDFLSPIVSDVAAPIVTALTDVGAGLCKGGIGAPGPLVGQKPTSPPVYTGTPGLPG